MWHHQDPDGFQREELLQLYTLLEGREKAFRDDLFRFTNFYSAVCYAILGVTLSGLVTLYSKGTILLVLVTGPFLALSVCWLAVRATGDIYRRILEEVAMKAKVENALGLDCSLPVQQFLGTQVIWPEDQCVMPTRHAARRLKEQSSHAFVKNSAVGGIYRENRFYFGIIALASILLSGVIVVLSFMF